MKNAACFCISLAQLFSVMLWLEEQKKQTGALFKSLGPVQREDFL